MRKLGLAIVALALTGFVSGNAQAQSAKFAADWSANTVTLVEITVGEAEGTNSSTDVQIRAAELMATIKVPQGKELLIGVSGVANLITFTKVKGKNKAGEITAVAEATMDLEVRFAPTGTADVCVTDGGTVAIPGAITFASRKQTLSIEVDLLNDGMDTITGFVTVALELDTTAAHHFNFLAVDLDSGEYDIWACFSGEAFKDIEPDALASSFVAVQQRIVTVQEVRAVKDSILTP